MIKLADEVKYLFDVSENIKLCVAQSKDSIQVTADMYEKN